jgi:beta-lactamase class A
MENNKTITTTFTIFLFLVGIVIGILIKSVLSPNQLDSYKEVRERGYEYINPLIDFESVDNTKQKELVKLHDDLEKYIENKTTKTDISHISVYYKDLNSGGWIGIREKEKFTPASLLKIPVMIAFYKIAETDPTYLNTELVYKSNGLNTIQNFTPEETLEEGKTYTINQLIEILIRYSDNNALIFLGNQIEKDKLTKIYNDLGMQDPNDNPKENVMTVKEYASFFRILYNSTYLNKEMSIKALKLLSETTYEEGIRSGVPNSVKVSSKFGERDYDENVSTSKQLHECGIVYHPKKPYILCIMTRGSDFKSLTKVISEISIKVYGAVDK